MKLLAGVVGVLVFLRTRSAGAGHRQRHAGAVGLVLAGAVDPARMRRSARRGKACASAQTLQGRR